MAQCMSPFRVFLYPVFSWPFNFFFSFVPFLFCFSAFLLNSYEFLFKIFLP